MNIQSGVSLADYSSWAVGGLAENFCLPTNLEELQIALTWAHERKQPITILGGGSNVLISDQGVKGLLICLRRFSGCEIQEKSGRLQLTAWSGTGKSELLKIFLKYKLAPALFLAGLPGDVGGGVVMNAGVAEMLTPREFVEIVDWFEVLRFGENSFSIQKYMKDEVQWSYRHSKGWEPGIITRVGMSWPLEPDPSILEKVKMANRTRLSKQPLDMPSCGSVFKNPEGHKSAQLIDSCGLKGFTIGQAQVSLKHANFIVNLGAAKAADMWAVIQHVRQIVLEKTGVNLVTEVIRLGEWS